MAMPPRRRACSSGSRWRSRRSRNRTAPATRYGFFHLGRLRSGATVQQVQAQLDALHAANVKRFPQFRFTELGMYSAVTPLQEALTRRVRRTLYLLWAGAGFVLLIGAINIANLSLARASARRRELATRLALGAARFQVARQLMIEAMVPAALGGAAGVAVGAAILQALVFTGLANLPNAADVRMNATAIGFVAARLGGCGTADRSGAGDDGRRGDHQSGAR